MSTQGISQCEEEVLDFMTNKAKTDTAPVVAETRAEIVTALPRPATAPSTRDHASIVNTFHSFQQKTHVASGVTLDRSSMLNLTTPSIKMTHETNVEVPSYDTMSAKPPAAPAVKGETTTDNLTKQILTRQRHPDYPLLRPSHETEQEVFEYKRQLKM